MKILGIDTSAKTSSVGIVEDGKVVDEVFVNEGLTHSETIMPMIDKLLKQNNISVDDIDAYAVNNGPGSFTGVRIGVAVVKGMAFKDDKDCYEVSTLDSIAYNCIYKDGKVVSCIDARRNQVFNAVYSVSKGKLTKEVNDRSILIKDLYEELKDVEENIYFVGDGQDKVLDYFSENDMLKENFKFPEYLENVQRGTNTAMIAYNNQSSKKKGKDILPQYLKLTQAEQELRKKREK